MGIVSYRCRGIVPWNSVFAIFIGFEAEITGKILKKRPIFSKNIIEIVRLQYHCSKTEFRGIVQAAPVCNVGEIFGTFANGKRVRARWTARMASLK